jgi:hypothetical protein
MQKTPLIALVGVGAFVFLCIAGFGTSEALTPRVGFEDPS